MIAVMALLVGVLGACSVWLLLQRHLLQLVLGLTLLAHAAVLTVFSSGGLVVGRPAFVIAGNGDLSGKADPLPQALILTAIVISLGTTAFVLAMLLVIARRYKTCDSDQVAGLKQ